MTARAWHPFAAVAAWLICGVALYNLRSVAPPVRTTQIDWGAVPFVLIQTPMVGVLIVAPGVVSIVSTKLNNIDVPIEIPRLEEPERSPVR